MDKPRPLWQTALLHLVLIASSVIFALPFVWLIGTSWKLDKEVQSEKVEILPSAPVPTARSPYVDSRAYTIDRPDDVGRHRWDEWMHRATEGEIGRIVDAWHDDRAKDLPPESLRGPLTAGVYQRIRGTL